MQLSPHFRLAEFASARVRGGVETLPPVHLHENLRRLAEQLEVLRAELGGVPVTVNSGWRMPEHNARVGGAAESQHLVGKAADIHVRGLEPREVAATVVRLIRAGRMHDGGLDVYETFVHYDIRQHPWRGKRARALEA